MTDTIAPAILSPITSAGRYLTFAIDDVTQVATALRELARQTDGEAMVIGIGQSLALALGREIKGLAAYPPTSFAGVDAPATPAALWCWLRGEDMGEILLRARAVQTALRPAFTLESSVDAFRYDAVDRDLSGYEDGTENPEGDEAVTAATVTGQGPGRDGSSFVVVQQWLHDFDRLAAIGPDRMDDVIGRHRADNSEMDDAPDTSHVSRTDQESFDPPAHLVRRSMPWSDGLRAGLMFVGFGRDFRAFMVQWQRMTGVEDGQTDALFRFTRPISGAFFWVPPMRGGQADLSALNIQLGGN
ncbi:MAG: Dyp-type peroxidase [Paracoccus sp. (in: a-proteobacteria)]|uniref:Dyp-type peroxidase n=1 Tax=Paracoccus sp. TaxID=267 RepID=UPI0026DEF73D|nr:Dyp-type peroxidase [Paracoccus sp. (in: a-proteobacteria)]MDO5631824.1 Dyp-type peroxidase [Paracoccus sp. (in: a-proteobacteria)]